MKNMFDICIRLKPILKRRDFSNFAKEHSPRQRSNRFNENQGSNPKRSKSSNWSPIHTKAKPNLQESAFEVHGNKLSANTGKNYLEYAFNQIYEEDSRNKDIFEDMLKRDIKAILKGKWLTMMTYGTSGSGKTHTIFGDSEGNQRGLVYLASEKIFRLFKRKKISFELSCSLLEIYNEQITNLFPHNKGKVELLEDEYGEVVLQRAEKILVENAEELREIIEAGAQSRHIAENFSNKRSSRSHMIVLLEIVFHYKGIYALGVTRGIKREMPCIKHGKAYKL